MAVFIMIPGESKPCRYCPELIVGGYIIKGRFFITCRKEPCAYSLEEVLTDWMARDGEPVILWKVRAIGEAS